MKNFRWVRFVFVISILSNLILATFLVYQNEIGEEAMEQIAFHGIQRNLVQLEGAITYQVNTGWANPSHVTEKLEDVIEGIGLAFEAGNRLGALDKENEKLLWDVIHYLNGYKSDSGFPNVVLSEKERDEFINLGRNLRSSGWGMNLSYGSGWGDFEQKARALLNSREIPLK